MPRLASVFFVLIAVCSIPLAASAQDTPPVLKNNDQPAGKPPVLRDGNAPSTTAVPAAKPTASPDDDEVISVETNLVTTPVSVLDRQGRFIPNLKKKDFKIYDNGVLQEVTYFQSQEQPFTVILLIDVSPSTKYKIDEIHYAAVTFVNQLRPNDKVMVVAFDSRVRALTEEPTSDKQKIYSAIYKANFGSGTSLYDAVAVVTDLDIIKVTGRKAVVIFTDGVDTTSRSANFESSLAGVQEVDALIYPIRYDTQTNTGIVSTTTGAATQLPKDIADMMAARGIALDPRAFRGGAAGTSPAAYAKGKEYLGKLAESSGGRIFEAADLTNLEAAFSGVAEELRRQYSIGYYPENPGQPGERRSVKIKVNRPNTVVRAKNGYIIRQARSKYDRPVRDSVMARNVD
jgi:VWFA-related protein